MLHKNPLHNIVNWTDETVNKIFNKLIDTYRDSDRISVEQKHNTIGQKRSFLISRKHEIGMK